MTEAGRRDEAFRSAMKRLPMAVIIVDGQGALEPYNRPAQELFEREGLPTDLLRMRPAHPLALLIESIRSSDALPEDATLTFPSGRCYAVQTSRRSEKGMNRWLMLLVTPSSATASPDEFEFTPRERQVAELMIAGAATDDICSSLSISRDTLKSHIGRLFEKTGTRSRAALVARLLRR